MFLTAFITEKKEDKNQNHCHWQLRLCSIGALCGSDRKEGEHNSILLRFI